MKNKEYLINLKNMSNKDLYHEFLGLLKRRAEFCFTKKNPQVKVPSHHIRLVRRNIARFKMVMDQRKKEE